VRKEGGGLGGLEGRNKPVIIAINRIRRRVLCKRGKELGGLEGRNEPVIIAMNRARCQVGGNSVGSKDERIW
jgi:hypothetical protein